MSETSKKMNMTFVDALGSPWAAMVEPVSGLKSPIGTDIVGSH